MAKHSDMTGAAALHQIAHHSDTDPTTTLGPYKAWFAPTSGAFKIRNAANSAWLPLTDATTAAALSAHLSDVFDAHDASAISFAPAGTVAATNVQAAIEEVVSEAAAAGATDLEGLSDVDLTSPAIRQGLFYDGTNFVNQMSPAQFVAPVSKTATFTALLAEHSYVCDATSGAITANLPTAVGAAGKQFFVKKTDASANAVTLDPNSTQTINGASTLVLSTQHEGVIIESDNANWFVTSRPRGGDTSPGSGTIAVEEDGSEEGTGIDRFDFTTGLNVSVSGSQATISVDTGSAYRTLSSIGADVTNATTTEATTGLSIAVTSGVTYRFEFFVPYDSTASTNGAQFRLDGPTVTSFFVRYEAPTASTTSQLQYQSTYNNFSMTSTAGTTNNFFTAKGMIKPSATGTLILYFRSEAGSPSSITIKAGSCVEYW